MCFLAGSTMSITVVCCGISQEWVRSGVDRLTVTALLQDGEYSVTTVGELLQLHDHHSWATNGSETTVLSNLVPLARRGDSFEIMDWVEPNSRSHTVGVYPGYMTVPGSP
jgi:hypothetical protein